METKTLTFDMMRTAVAKIEMSKPERKFLIGSKQDIEIWKKEFGSSVDYIEIGDPE